MYSFKLTYNGTTVDVHPLYSGLAISSEKESDEEYFRDKLTGKIKLIDTEFDLVMSQPFDTRFALDLYEDTNRVISVFFFRNYCKVNEDDKTLELSWETDDDYNKLKSVLEIENDVIKIAPDIGRVTIKHRPIIQIYIPGDTVITNMITGVYWEQNATPVVSDNDLTNTYKFNKSKEFGVVIGGGVAGEYDITSLERTDGAYHITHHVYDDGDTQTPNDYWWTIDDSSGTEIFKSDTKQADFDCWGETYNEINGSDVAYSSEVISIYTRYLLDIDNINGTATFPIPADDITDKNNNYRYVYPIQIDTLIASTEMQTEPTKYGKSPDSCGGQYYKELVLAPSTGIGKCFPVGRHQWGCFSVWFYFEAAYWVTDELYTREVVIKDNFELSSVINKLLEGSGLSHDSTCSQFLYGSEGVQFSGKKYYLTPKSNIKVGDYDNPASRAKITLKDLLDSLRTIYRLYYHIENGKLIIEHVKYYNNGHSYSGTPVVDVDLTTILAKNNKPWGFLTSKFHYDKAKIPERIEYGWMDEVSNAFTGHPIIIDSGYKTTGLIDKKEIMKITTDVDFIVGSPGDVADDGFVLMLTDSKNKITMVDVSDGNNNLKLQNGYLSFLYIVPVFHLNDLPAKNITFGDAQYVANSILKTKLQDKVIFPRATYNNGLIKTSLGNGFVNKIVLNLGTQMYEVELSYEPE